MQPFARLIRGTPSALQSFVTLIKKKVTLLNETFKNVKNESSFCNCPIFPIVFLFGWNRVINHFAIGL